MLYIAFLVLAGLIAGAIVLYQARQRERRRDVARKRYGKQCPACHRYLHPAAAICKYCYARQLQQ